MVHWYFTLHQCFLTLLAQLNFYQAQRAPNLYQPFSPSNRPIFFIWTTIYVTFPTIPSSSYNCFRHLRKRNSALYQRLCVTSSSLGQSKPHVTISLLTGYLLTLNFHFPLDAAPTKSLSVIFCNPQYFCGFTNRLLTSSVLPNVKIMLNLDMLQSP